MATDPEPETRNSTLTFDMLPARLDIKERKNKTLSSVD